MSSDMPQPVHHGYFDADRHRIKWYRYGNEKGTPVLFLHGGPGSGFDPDYANFFDLDNVNLVTFDQRGSGKSEPAGSMEDNTPQALIRDIETLRNLLGIETWIVAGHSWGATLALLYAQAHPQAVRAVTVCGLFLGRREDREWAFDGARQFFADTLDDLKQALGAEDYGHAIIEKALAIHKHGSDQEKIDASYALTVYNAPFSRLVPNMYRREDISEAAIHRNTILLSYYQKNFDLRENQICDNALKLGDIPVTLVHGRLDMDCPVAQAFAFQNVRPQTKLIVVHGSHSLCEEPLRTTYRDALTETLRADGDTNK